MDLRSWLGTTTPGQKGQTRGPASVCEADVREEVRESSKKKITGLWRLNGDRGRATPSKEYVERVRARDLLVVSYVSSYDVSSNPTVVEGESIQSVKKNRFTLVEQWYHCSSDREQHQRMVTPPPTRILVLLSLVNLRNKLL
jgi:hypothetical protein